MDGCYYGYNPYFIDPNEVVSSIDLSPASTNMEMGMIHSKFSGHGLRILMRFICEIEKSYNWANSTN